MPSRGMGKSFFDALAAVAEGAASGTVDEVARAGDASDGVTSDGVREQAAAETQTTPPTRMAIALEGEGMDRRTSKERTYHCGTRRCKPANG